MGRNSKMTLNIPAAQLSSNLSFVTPLMPSQSNTTEEITKYAHKQPTPIGHKKLNPYFGVLSFSCRILDNE
tara:strand:- start:348 stop:560 length:213 start_codon:yes stop_codon:yes gene_type:complete